MPPQKILEKTVLQIRDKFGSEYKQLGKELSSILPFKLSWYKFYLIDINSWLMFHKIIGYDKKE